MALSANQILPRVQIGEELLGDALLTSVEVLQELNRHGWCTVVCRNTADRRLAAESWMGQTLTVVSMDDTGTEQNQFSGMVHSVRLVYEVWGSYTAHVTGVTATYRMDLAARKHYYPAADLLSVAGTLGARDGVQVAVEAPAGKPLDYVQYGETDFAFLTRIVDDGRAWLRPVADGLQICSSFQPGVSVQWRGEGELLDFALQGRLAAPGFAGAHYDHHAMESHTFAAQSTSPARFDGAAPLSAAVEQASKRLPAGFEPQRARAMTLGDYQAQLGAEAERSIGSAVTGRGRSRTQALMAGNTVTLEGVLDAQGTYGLTRVRHLWTSAGYSNEFVCTPWKNFHHAESPGVSTWKGLVPARVIDHNDPRGMGRIKVQFFWQESATRWARAVSPHAGPGRGFMFLPEVGDEVAVAFEDGDPERPVLLGSLWNGVQQAPRYGLRGDDVGPNDVKRLITKSGNRLHMTDKPGQETVVVATPNHTALRMTETHSDTGRPTLHIHSSGDILITAPNGRVHIGSSLFSRDIGPGQHTG